MEQIINTYALADGIEAFVVTRGDATLSDPYSGINVCHYVRDAQSHVRDSRREVCRCLGIREESLVVPRQIHSADVAILIGGSLLAIGCRCSGDPSVGRSHRCVDCRLRTGGHGRFIVGSDCRSACRLAWSSRRHN